MKSHPPHHRSEKTEKKWTNLSRIKMWLINRSGLNLLSTFKETWSSLCFEPRFERCTGLRMNPRIWFRSMNPESVHIPTRSRRSWKDPKLTQTVPFCHLLHQLPDGKYLSYWDITMALCMESWIHTLWEWLHLCQCLSLGNNIPS